MSTDAPARADVPIPDEHVEAAARRHDVDIAALRSALATLYSDLVDGADAIHTYYADGDNPESITARDGLVTVLFVDEETWNRQQSDPTGDLGVAARTAHAAFARELGADSSVLDATVPLVMPSETVGRLVRAGLSHRQAQIQVLRDAGLTQSEIGDRLGLATNTVKVHRHRIDTKVENARQLLGLVD